MAHTGIFAASDEILVKAGEAYDTSVTEARINALCLQVESSVNVRCIRNYSDDYASLSDDVRGILSEIESNLVAAYIIDYNIEGYESREAARVKALNLRSMAEKLLSYLEQKGYQDFMDRESP